MPCRAAPSLISAAQIGDDGVLVSGAASYSGWDQDKIYSCVCAGRVYAGYYHQTFAGFEGHDCGDLTCPSGDDPKTYDQNFEVQRLTCISGDAGTFTLTFRQQTTQPISVSAPLRGPDPTSLQAMLESLSTIR